MSYPKNKVVEKLKKDELVTCLKINITDNIPAEIAALAGADCVWVDQEHIGTDYREVISAMLGARKFGAEVIVRTPCIRGAYSNVTRLLELDASGVMVPHVMDVEDAKKIGYYTKFYPIGRRPLDGGSADGHYCMMDSEDYIRYSNEEKLTIIQIEDKEALDVVDEIAEVPGIDMLFFGPADFSHSIGKPTDLGNPETARAREKVAEVARKHGKWAGTVGSPGNAKELYDMGYRFINVGADVVAISAAFSDAIRKVKALGL